MGPFIEGIFLGMTLAIFFGFGPALFALLQTSMHRGFMSGLWLALGIFLSDLALVGLCFVGSIQIISKPENQLAFAIISGIILIIFGLVTYTRKAYESKGDEEVKVKTPNPIMYILKGFFMNFTNPFVWIFWMGTIVGFTANYGGDAHSVFWFFTGALLTVFLTDILKSFTAYKIKNFLTPKTMQLINHVAGIGLILFGLFLIARGLFTF